MELQVNTKGTNGIAACYVVSGERMSSSGGCGGCRSEMTVVWVEKLGIKRVPERASAYPAWYDAIPRLLC